jgi:archaemetzincin
MGSNAVAAGLELDMPANLPIIGICSIGDVPGVYEKIIAGHLAAYLHLAGRLLPGIALPSSAFVQERGRYDAAAIVRKLESRKAPGCTKLIGVTAVDLFVPIFNHLFGEARQNGRAALVSTFRLVTNTDGSVPAPAVVYERTSKVAIHEMGHLFNLVHCSDDHCLMHFSGNLDELDQIELLFCRYCRAYLQDSLRRA